MLIGGALANALLSPEVAICSIDYLQIALTLREQDTMWQQSSSKKLN